MQRLLPDLRLEYTALPWSRCLQLAAEGQYDAVLSASHTPERARSLVYPGGAEADPQQRMFMVGYALLRRKGSAASWDGQRFLGTGPQAGQSLGAERGYSIVQFAREHGAHVEDRYPQVSSLLDSLKLGRLAGVLINQEYAAQLLSETAWAQGFELGGPQLAAKAYYLPFSRAFAQREPDRVRAIWAAIAKARQQPEFVRQFSLTMSAGLRRDIKP
ncbi:substrate-binding periplasmic protein [Inhella inkyongensis]|uniref:substrate-binding periplasmic protein n=1 Tax=Inhella inkyongensis TaxID=392593 RepID=UPI00160D0429|nr:transporter substrate-binding domain-containing protein [Inhella inkyongensis]